MSEEEVLDLNRQAGSRVPIVETVVLGIPHMFPEPGSEILIVRKVLPKSVSQPQHAYEMKP